MSDEPQCKRLWDLDFVGDAIAHGARWVYDTDDDNELQREGERAIPLPRGGALLDEAETPTSHVVNLYPQLSDAPSSHAMRPSTRT